jgi:hypothetical protein
MKIKKMMCPVCGFDSIEFFPYATIAISFSGFSGSIDEAKAYRCPNRHIFLTVDETPAKREEARLAEVAKAIL